jgi:hypothetical protein
MKVGANPMKVAPLPAQTLGISKIDRIATCLAVSVHPAHGGGFGGGLNGGPPID